MTAQLKTIATNYDEKVQLDAHSVFPEFFAQGERNVSQYRNRHPKCIVANQDYVPELTVLKRFLSWLHAPYRPQCFGLHGETGTGKTEFFLWVADRLNIPVYMVKVHKKLMPEDLEGYFGASEGSKTFDEGPALQAYRNGGILLLDEVDKMNDITSAATHNLVEEKPWPIEKLNEVVEPHPNFCLAVTGNTMGEGGSERYTSSNRLDGAWRARIGWYRTVYPDADRELTILKKKYNREKEILPNAMFMDMIRLANSFRDALLGSDRKGLEDPIGAIFSTRTLVNWAYWSLGFGADASWSESLDFAFQGSVDPESKEEVYEIINAQFGDLIGKSLQEVVQHYAAKK